MSLYREDATGFIVDLPGLPGAGYTALGSPPVAPMSAVMEWWRDLDRGTLTSAWHPSLIGGMETPKPPGLAGSGINIFPARYSNFEEERLPVIVTNGCTIEMVPGGFNGANRLQITATADNGEVWLTPSLNTYNIKLTPNLRWILSGYFGAGVSNFAFTALALTAAANGSAGATYEFPVTLDASWKWVRRHAALDLREDHSTGALFGVRLATTGDVLAIDALMLEELLGDTVQPSAYSCAPTIVSGDQVDTGSLSFSMAVMGGDFEPQAVSPFPVYSWFPVVPEARFRGKIALSCTVEVFRPDANGFDDIVLTIQRESVTVKTVTVTFVPGQRYGIIHGEYVDNSGVLDAINYQLGLHCATTAFHARGSGRILEVKK